MSVSPDGIWLKVRTNSVRLNALQPGGDEVNSSIRGTGYVTVTVTL